MRCNAFLPVGLLATIVATSAPAPQAVTLKTKRSIFDAQATEDVLLAQSQAAPELVPSIIDEYERPESVNAPTWGVHMMEKFFSEEVCGQAYWHKYRKELLVGHAGTGFTTQSLSTVSKLTNFWCGYDGVKDVGLIVQLQGGDKNDESTAEQWKKTGHFKPFLGDPLTIGAHWAHTMLVDGKDWATRAGAGRDSEEKASTTPTLTELLRDEKMRVDKDWFAMDGHSLDVPRPIRMGSTYMQQHTTLGADFLREDPAELENMKEGDDAGKGFDADAWGGPGSTPLGSRRYEHEFLQTLPFSDKLAEARPVACDSGSSVEDAVSAESEFLNRYHARKMRNLGMHMRKHQLPEEEQMRLHTRDPHTAALGGEALNAEPVCDEIVGEWDPRVAVRGLLFFSRPSADAEEGEPQKTPVDMGRAPTGQEQLESLELMFGKIDEGSDEERAVRGKYFAELPRYCLFRKHDHGSCKVTNGMLVRL